MKIGLLFVATGKYKKFVEPVIKSCRENFLPGHQKKFFIFTDGDFSSKDTVTYKIERGGFPKDTLHRYHYFLLAKQQILDETDCVYYLDVDMLVNQTVGDEILPGRHKPFIGVAHPGFYNNRTPNAPYGTPESRKESHAYLDPQLYRPCYWAGGFQGGLSSAYMQMSEIISERIDADHANGLIAIWHDESHINRFYSENHNLVKTLLPSYCYPESWDLPYEKLILALDKNHSEVRSEL